MHAVGLGMSACLANCKSIAKTWPKIHQPYGFKITVLEREWGLTYLYPQGLIDHGGSGDYLKMAQGFLKKH